MKRSTTRTNNRRQSRTDRPIPYTLTDGSKPITKPRVGDLVPIQHVLAVGDLATANGNDEKYFERVEEGADLVPFLVPRADILPISSALFRSNEPGAMNLALRFPHFRTPPAKGGQSTP